MKSWSVAMGAFVLSGVFSAVNAMGRPLTHDVGQPLMTKGIAQSTSISPHRAAFHGETPRVFRDGPNMEPEVAAGVTTAVKRVVGQRDTGLARSIGTVSRDTPSPIKSTISPASTNPSVSQSSPVIQNKPWVLGYYTQYSPDSVASQNSLRANLNAVTAIAPLWYSYRADGSLVTMGYHRAFVRTYAVAHGIGVYPLVTNAGGNDTILTNATIRGQVVQSLTQMAVRDQYPGYNIDFEQLNYWDRQAMSDFVVQLADALNPLGKVVTVAVIPKTFTDPYGRAYDYHVLGQYADKVVLMTYDYHCIGSAAGPIAPIGWVTDAVNYALSRMPANKIVLGLAAYGYDWGSDGTTVEVHDQEAVSLAEDQGVPIQWNGAYQEPWFTYTSGGVSHTVWFENGYSDAFKIALAQQDHLGGVAIWRLGDEDSHLWAALDNVGY
ncbi:MAG: glycosyl hydrolase family 18 protein [Sulfobacillus sp.]